MRIFGCIFLAMLAALGVALAFLEFLRRSKAKRSHFVCICFQEEFSENENPDMIIICRTDADQEEIIKRIGQTDDRRIYLKYI